VARDGSVRVLVVADDLMWSTRLLSQAQAAGAAADAVRDLGGLRREIAAEFPDLVIVDLSNRAFDGVEAVAHASSAGARVLAVAQHEDLELRRRALAAGASRVYAYGKVHADGVALIRRWLDGSDNGAPIEPVAASQPG
jgi:DNA-binding response OmpR family regulator